MTKVQHTQKHMILLKKKIGGKGGYSKILTWGKKRQGESGRSFGKPKYRGA